MKLPSDALVEYRCDCGSLIGYSVRDGGVVLATLGDRLVRGDRGSTTWSLPVNVDPREYMVASCGRHDRVITADELACPPVGSKRHKVIVRRTNFDGVPGDQ